MGNGLSFARACARLGLSQHSVKYVLDSDPELTQLYIVAQQARADYYAERALDIGLAVFAGKGEADRGRVAIDAIKWFTGAHHPTKYRDRTNHVTTDIAVTVATTDATDQQRARAIASLMARQKARRKLEIPDDGGQATQADAAGPVQVGAEDQSAPDPGSADVERY